MGHPGDFRVAIALYDRELKYDCSRPRMLDGLHSTDFITVNFGPDCTHVFADPSAELPHLEPLKGCRLGGLGPTLMGDVHLMPSRSGRWVHFPGVGPARPSDDDHFQARPLGQHTAKLVLDAVLNRLATFHATRCAHHERLLSLF